MLTLDGIGIEFSGRWLLRNATYQFLKGERVGLIGRNGAGKSTLLKMIAGEQSPTEGRVAKAGGVDIAYFSQDLLSYETRRPIIEVARDAFAPLLALQADIENILARLEKGESDPTLLDELAAKQAEFDTKGGPQMEAQVHSILSGLGFPAESHHEPFHTFSGGWRMRVLLAKMLLMNPAVLLLDEPTNHLDLPSIQWLEGYLKNFPGTSIVVSHDRFFIDRMATKILEISLQQLFEYTGNYSFYLKEKALREEQQLRAYENQQKHIADQEKFINRFRYKASKARQVQSKIKQLEKLEKILPPEEEHVNLNIRFRMQTVSGKEVMTLKEVDKAYGPKEIIQGGAGSIWRGDKIALIGANGLGKSTLLRILADREPFVGNRKLGHQVVPSFFAQHQLEALNLGKTILQEVTDDSVGKTEQELRTILGCFMFSGEDVEKKIKVLSGGEKSRVALAKTLISEANFLLLDEPTNHLDIPSIQILVEALKAYEGTYIIVSHDRFFLSQVANKIWYLEDKKIWEYAGTYQEYEYWLSKQTPTEAEIIPEKKPDKSEGATSGLSYKEQKQAKNRLRKLERDQVSIEEKIESLEAEIAHFDEQMGLPEMARDFEKLQALQADRDNRKATLEETTEQWEAVLIEIEELAEKLKG